MSLEPNVVFPPPTAGPLPVIERANLNTPYAAGGGGGGGGPTLALSSLTVSSINGIGGDLVLNAVGGIVVDGPGFGIQFPSDGAIDFQDGLGVLTGVSTINGAPVAGGVQANIVTSTLTLSLQATPDVTHSLLTGVTSGSSFMSITAPSTSQTFVNLITADNAGNQTAYSQLRSLPTEGQIGTGLTGSDTTTIRMFHNGNVAINSALSTNVITTSQMNATGVIANTVGTNGATVSTFVVSSINGKNAGLLPSSGQSTISFINVGQPAGPSFISSTGQLAYVGGNSGTQQSVSFTVATADTTVGTLNINQVQSGNPLTWAWVAMPNIMVATENNNGNEMLPVGIQCQLSGDPGFKLQQMVINYSLLSTATRTNVPATLRVAMSGFGYPY